MTSGEPTRDVDSLPQGPSASALGHLIANVTLWIVLVGLLVLFRILLIWIFRGQLASNVSLQSFALCLGTGIRYDIQIASFVMLPSLVVTLISFVIPLGKGPTKIHAATVIFCVIVIIPIFIGDVAYIAEYGDQFNVWVFGLIYDDRSAVMKTAWKTYPIVWLTLAGLLGVFAAVKGLLKVCRSVSKRIDGKSRVLSVRFKAATIIIVAALAACSLRGSMGRRPVQLKDAAVTGDDFLNKLVMNPFTALRYSIHQHRQLQTAQGLRSLLHDDNILSAARALFPNITNAVNLDDYVARIAPGSSSKPDHIFLIVMESYDAWPMKPQFAELGLTTKLEELGRQGIQAGPFLSAGSGTMTSLDAIITGLPHNDVNVNYRPSARAGFPTSIAKIFRRLGYRTRFFYGGYLSWQRIGEFCKEQGFEEVYGGDQMSASLSGNEWGVDDELLFKFILEHPAKEPTFNMVMSTSYHPPFSVDVVAKGFPLETVAKTRLGQQLAQKDLQIYGHLWYADHSLGDFVISAERQFENSLFAITGDHFGRRFPAQLRPTLYERKGVPFVLYGKKALEQVRRPETMVGSHMDIAPTLINLAAPTGFAYASFGRDLLDSSQPQIGFGVGTVTGTNFVFEVSNASHVEDLLGQSQSTNAYLDSLELQYRQLHALSWWWVMRGASLATNYLSSSR